MSPHRSERPRASAPGRWRLAAGAWAAVVLLLLVLPVGDRLGDWPLLGAGGFQHWDKVVHVVLFAVMAAFLLAAWGRRWPWGRRLGPFLGATGYGLATEVLQAFIPWRSASAADLLADAAGALLVVLCWRSRREP